MPTAVEYMTRHQWVLAPVLSDPHGHQVVGIGHARCYRLASEALQAADRDRQAHPGDWSWGSLLLYRDTYGGWECILHVHPVELRSVIDQPYLAVWVRQCHREIESAVVRSLVMDGLCDAPATRSVDADTIDLDDPRLHGTEDATCNPNEDA